MAGTMIASVVASAVVVAAWAVDVAIYHEKPMTPAPLGPLAFSTASIDPQVANDVAERDEVVLPR